MAPTSPTAPESLPTPVLTGAEIGAFDDPESYLRNRRGRFGFRGLKTWAERRALAACLDAAGPLTRICDCPSGPGRLVSFWNGRGVTILCVDASAPMVAAAGKRIADLRAPGRAIEARAEDLVSVALPQPDLVSSVRFLYYFDRESRLTLLRAFAAATRRFVLVQYKTSETWKGRRNALRERHGRAFCSRSEIEAELAAAGLHFLAFRPISQFSDRAFVLAETTDRTDRPSLR